MDETIWNMFMNDCMWSQNSNNIETAQALLQALRDAAGEFYGINMEQNWKTEWWISLSLLEPPTGSVLRTDALCSNETWSTKIFDYEPREFEDKYDLTGRQVQFHWHIFTGSTACQIMREVLTFVETKRSCDFNDRIIFMSMLNDIEW